jgi:hypothetical protein
MGCERFLVQTLSATLKNDVLDPRLRRTALSHYWCEGLSPPAPSSLIHAVVSLVTTDKRNRTV